MIAKAISTHALREEGDAKKHGFGGAEEISTHALREEGDQDKAKDNLLGIVISTHALREEGDGGD